MNKKNFFRTLERKLNPLNKEERKEIIEFYEERFEEGERENKTEAEIIRGLETPEEIANNVLDKYDINKEVEKNKISIMQIVGILLFDIMFGFGIVVSIISVMFGIFITSISLLPASFYNIIIKAEGTSFLVRLNEGLIGIGMSVIIFFAGIYLLPIAGIIIGKMINANSLAIIGKRVIDEKGRNKIIVKIKSYTKKSLIYAITCVVINLGVVQIAYKNKEDDVSKEVVEVFNSTEPVNIELYLKEVDLTLKFHDDDTILVDYNGYGNEEVIIDVNNEKNKIKIKNNGYSNKRGSGRMLGLSFTPKKSRYATLYLPEDIKIKNFKVEKNIGNTNLDFANKEVLETMQVYTYYAKEEINVKNLKAKEVIINGDILQIEVNDVVADDMKLITVKGSVDIKNVKTDNLYSRVTLGEIKIDNVNEINEGKGVMELDSLKIEIFENEINFSKYIENGSTEGRYYR